MKRLTLAQEAELAAKKAMGIPGQIKESEAAFLYRLAKRKGNLVEIGCLFGRSTSVLVRAGRAFGAELTTVDPFYRTENTDKKSSPEIWQQHLKDQGLEPPNLMHMTSHEAAALYDKEISFLFVDGGHGYRTVIEDIADWTPKVKESGIVVFHDMFMPNIRGVTKAVSEWWLDQFSKNKPLSWRLVGMVDYMIAFRRVES